jgi:hypothetical protein
MQKCVDLDSKNVKAICLQIMKKIEILFKINILEMDHGEWLSLY